MRAEALLGSPAAVSFIPGSNPVVSAGACRHAITIIPPQARSGADAAIGQKPIFELMPGKLEPDDLKRGIPNVPRVRQVLDSAGNEF